jgi:hypothetical protein
MTPADKLCAAIGILQAHILARETTLDSRQLWPHADMRTAGLEAATALLLELLPHVAEGKA